MNTQDLQRAIGARLKQARLARGITQAELGERIAVSRAIIANYETGRSAIPAVLLVQAAAICRTSLAAFDPRAEDATVARIIQTLYERPDVVVVVDDVLRSFALHSAYEPAPAGTFSHVSTLARSDGTAQ